VVCSKFAYYFYDSKKGQALPITTEPMKVPGRKETCPKIISSFFHRFTLNILLLRKNSKYFRDEILAVFLLLRLVFKSPHTFRHTTAMHLFQSGVDITVIALWLGHESPATTHMYVEADLTMKENALKKLQGPSLKSLRYQASDSILSFLESL